MNTKVVGIHDGHNAAVCLLMDGVIAGALQEERLTRIKNQQGFPEGALEAVLSSNSLRLSDVDAFVYAGHEQILGPHTREEAIQAYRKVAGLNHLPRRLLRRTFLSPWRQAIRRARRVQALTSLGVPAERVHFIEHHRCHAYSAYYGSPWRDKDVLIITCDGAGDGFCATVSLPEHDGRGLLRVGAVREDHSLGILWALVTSYMGMVPLEHEYKMMGMAPYADEKRKRKLAGTLSSWFREEDDPYLGWTRLRGLPPIAYAYGKVRGVLELQRFDDVCGGLQFSTEELICPWIEACIKKSGKRKVALSGGLFMNVKVNERLVESDAVHDLFVFPSCGDESNTFGAAYAYLADAGLGGKLHPVNSLFLGPDYAAQFSNALDEARQLGFSVKLVDDLNAEVAQLLADGEVVARFQGREEFGARALGHRSILAGGRNPLVVERINSMVKKRDFWMPFASSIMEEDADRYLINPKNVSSPYMMIAFDTTPLAAQHLIAGMHPRDHTIRAQIVSKKAAPDFHDLLAKYKSLTGVGGILNTSFNLHGHPIVSNPAEALKVVAESGLRYLAMENYLISKNGDS